MHHITNGVVSALLVAVGLPVSAGAEQAATTRIPVDATLYRRHQVCLADVRGAAGRITALHLIPSVSSDEVLDELMIRVHWDGLQTPFIACSLAALLGLLAPDGAPMHLPELALNHLCRRALITCSRTCQGCRETGARQKPCSSSSKPELPVCPGRPFTRLTVRS